MYLYLYLSICILSPLRSPTLSPNAQITALVENVVWLRIRRELSSHPNRVRINLYFIVYCLLLASFSCFPETSCSSTYQVVLGIVESLMRLEIWAFCNPVLLLWRRASLQAIGGRLTFSFRSRRAATAAGLGRLRHANGFSRRAYVFRLELLILSRWRAR